jgi:hypothetical protein
MQAIEIHNIANNFIETYGAEFILGNPFKWMEWYIETMKIRNETIIYEEYLVFCILTKSSLRNLIGMKVESAFIMATEKGMIKYGETLQNETN